MEVFYVLIGTGKQNILTLLYEAIVLGQESKGLPQKHQLKKIQEEANLPSIPPKKVQKEPGKEQNSLQLLGDYKVLKRQNKTKQKQQEYSVTTLARYYKV